MIKCPVCGRSVERLYFETSESNTCSVSCALAESIDVSSEQIREILETEGTVDVSHLHVIKD